MALLSSPSSTTKVDTASIQVSAVRTTISTVSSHDNTANLSDATVYAFLTSQPNGSQLVHEDQEQIHEDDLKEMDLKWQLDLLCIRARRYFQKTGKKITINDSNTARYDKTNVECFNCHNMGHFEMECKSPKNQESKPRNQDISRKTVIMEDTSSKAMVAIDGADASFRDSEITALILQIEKLKKEKESNQIKIDNFENASKSLDKLVGSQISDNSKIVLGFTRYNDVAPLPTGLFAPLSIDLSNSGLEEFQHPEFNRYGPKDSKNVYLDTSNEIKKAPDALIIKDWVSGSDEDESEEIGASQDALKDQGYSESGCSRHMTGNISYLNDFKEHDEGFTWVFFLATKDETSRILKSFITDIENLVEKKVKIIRCDNETKFKNRGMNEFCKEKGIKREYSVARTPQQNEVAERRNRTLIEVVRTMLADSKLPTTF
uniref:Putative ribonuclease H-like domain-containing protein n=1 Tax=Tanacetum cinerariifolium TaxID=118510 RepID=A0A699J4X7_TANCI|nr:putative ribonuclease H-like domain-containing protein [Tanacetum cinerariifolium]